MDRQQILLAKALDAAGVSLNVDTFDDRLILQKTVYLLQAAGVHLGYRFRWYLRGPYSPDMTAAAFGISEEGESARSELVRWKLDSDSASRVRNLKPLLHVDGEQKAKLARRLELLASVLFLIKTEQTKANDFEATSKILKSNGKQFDASEVRNAVSELKKYGVLA